MSKRSDRRAAERAAHKINRSQNSTAAQSAVTTPTEEQPTVTAASACTSPAYNLDFLQQADNSADTISEARFAVSEAQLHANRENAQKSTGPQSPEGKATVSQNRRSHGLTGRFLLLGDEKRADYEALTEEIFTEYHPQNETEVRLANSVIQHYWLMQRALLLQENALSNGEDKKLSLYLRYHSTHERSYYKAQKELQKLRKERTKEQNGFEPQIRKNEMHEAKVRLTHANAQRMEIDSSCRQVMEAPIPGNHKLSFEQLTKACSEAIADLVFKSRTAEAAA